MSTSHLISTGELNFIAQLSTREHQLSLAAEGATKSHAISTGIQTQHLQEHETQCQTQRSSLSLDHDDTRFSLGTQTDSHLSHIKAWLQNQTPQSKLENKKHLSQFLRSDSIAFMARILNQPQIALNYHVNWNDDVTDVALVHSIAAVSNASVRAPSTHASSANLSVALVTWNDLGHLAISYEPQRSTSSTQNSAWCMHSGLIVVKRSFNSNSTTDIRIEVSESIVTAMDFYPGRGNILAAGTYDGTLKVWKLAKETEKLICESRVHELYSHRDPISQIAWLKTRADRSIVLASMSTEGRFSIWTVKNDFVQPIAIFMLNDVERGGLAFGVTCFSFNNIHAGASIRSMNRSSIIPTTDNYFLFGTEVGRVARSTLNGGKLLDTKAFVKGASLPDTKPKPNGTEFEYDTGIGYVHAVECSPYNKNLFLSASSEGFIRIFNVYQSTDILTLQPSEKMIYAAQWSPFRPCVLAAGGEDGHLYVYDLMESTVTPAIEIAVSTHAVTQVKFDPENAEHIVTGDAEGFVKVWRLNNRLTSLQPHEFVALQSLESGGVGVSSVEM